MSLKKLISARRAYRSLKRVTVDEGMIHDLASHAQLAPSCFNKQPWRFIFVTDPEVLSDLAPAISQGNAWTQQASMIIAVFSQPELDCVIKEREYYSFDTGMAAAFLILRATEMGLVAHPIAGFDEEQTKQILNIPADNKLITLLIVGQKADTINPALNEKMVESEKKRPPRFPLSDFVYLNQYWRVLRRVSRSRRARYRAGGRGVHREINPVHWKYAPVRAVQLGFFPVPDWFYVNHWYVL